MSEAFRFTRAIRFDEIDAAGYVYFPRLCALPHEGIERMLEEALPDGGYAGYVVGRRTGLPCVRIESDFRAPFRFGDRVTVEMRVGHLGKSSVRFDVTLLRGDGVHCATIAYTCAFTALDGPTSAPLPDELRTVFSRYLAVSGGPSRPE
jgi:4-hydroxybenzoyl-CoA thioesterase